MKLEPLFTVNNNKLYKIQDNCEFSVDSLVVIKVLQNDVQIEDDIYNEEYLASLRENLKTLEEQNKFCVLIPHPSKQLKTQEDFELFINTFNHTARRIKDCISMIGYELPEHLLISNEQTLNFIQTLEKKHSQYIYFVKKENAQKLELSLIKAYKEFVVW